MERSSRVTGTARRAVHSSFRTQSRKESEPKTELSEENDTLVQIASENKVRGLSMPVQSNSNWQGRRRRHGPHDRPNARRRREAGRKGLMRDREQHTRFIQAAMQAYRDMTVYPETDDEADGNRRRSIAAASESDNKVNGVGGLHSGLQARAQVKCGGATDAVARQGTLLPSLIAVPAGYFFVASPQARHQTRA